MQITETYYCVTVYSQPINHFSHFCRYLNHPGQLSLPSLRGWYIEYRPALPGLRRGVFTCVGW